MKSNELSVHVLLVTFQFMSVKSASAFVLGHKIHCIADSLHGSVLPPGGTSAETS